MPGDREATFQLISDVIVKGGFDGLGDLRDVEAYETILSGDLNGDSWSGDVYPDFGCPTGSYDPDPTWTENSYNVVTGSGTDETAKMLRANLVEADIPYVDDGFFFDFHAQRHQTGTLLAASGAHPKVAQSIMRHSDINLTMSRYSHTLTGQEAEAIAALPDLSTPSKQKAVATGTDGKTDLASCLALQGGKQHISVDGSGQSHLH